MEGALQFLVRFLRLFELLRSPPLRRNPEVPTGDDNHDIPEEFLAKYVFEFDEHGL